jgi:hypothetical protein
MADRAPDRIMVPRLLSRSVTMWLSVGAAVVAMIAILVWAVLTQPLVNMVSGIVAVLIISGLLGFLIGRRTWVDTANGAVGRDVWGLLPRATRWADADQVRVRSNRGGQALLEVRGGGHRTSIYLPLVAVDLGGDRTQAPGFLRMLAEQIQTWAPQRTAVVDGLGAQV